MPSSQQAKLLRVIETGEFERVGSSRTRKVDVRIVSATNADLAAEVEAGRFRQDLLFRLNTIEVVLPPLRERREDIPLLARHFLSQHTQRYRKGVTGFEPAALQLLMDHRWPGNVRELRNYLERCLALDVEAPFELEQRTPQRDLSVDARTAYAEARQRALTAFEREYLQKLIALHEGNVSKAARAAEMDALLA